MIPYRVKPPPPTTINPLYENYAHGAPLSDIGEEESTPRSKKTARSRSPSPTRSKLSSQPLNFGPPLLRHKNRLSISSDTSIGSDPGNWEDFDSSNMMTARLAADVARADNEMTEIDGPGSKRNSMIAAPEDEVSFLNQKAERILADAKRRLTLMEDNLSKARNSMMISPRTSPTMGDPHQPGGLYRSISQGGDRRLGPGYVRKSKSLLPVGRNLSVGHARVSSENAASLEDFQYSPQVRSASALEFNRRMEAGLPDQFGPGHTGHSSSSSRSYNSPLRALQEEGTNESSATNMTSPQTPRSSTITQGLGITTSSPATGSLKRASSTSTPTGHARTASQASTQSTRELRERMSDLKSRIESLTQTSQSDSLRRQSSGKLRTPSPLNTAPESFYAAAPEYQNGGTPINDKAGLGWSPSKSFNDSPRSMPSPQDSAFGEGRLPANTTPMTVRTDVNTPNLTRKTIDKLASGQSSHQYPSAVQGSHYEDAEEELDSAEDNPVAASQEEQIYLNEALEESLQAGEPDIPIMMDHDDFLQEHAAQAERHEDRVDAFDYENMFLHSALGNYSHSQAREEEEEESDTESEDSVETRRAVARTPTGDEQDDEGDEDEEEEGTECDSETDSESNTKNLSAGSTDPLAGIDEPPTPRASTAILHPPLKAPNPPWMKAARSNSMDSVSTAATFATATEGRDGDEDDDEGEDGMPDAILNWGNVPGSYVSSPLTNGAWSATPRLEPAVQMNGGGYGSARPVSRGKERQYEPVVNGRMTTPESVVLNNAAAMSPRSIPLPQSPRLHNHHQRQSSQVDSFGLDPQPSYNQEHQQPHYPPPSHISQQSHQRQHHQTQPANTEILMASLITLAEPTFTLPHPTTPSSPSSPPSNPTIFADVDKQLVISLLRAVGGVCGNVMAIGGKGEDVSNEQEMEKTAWRRRLEVARLVLEGRHEGSL